MSYKWIGAAMVIASCSGFGFTLAATHRKSELHLRQMIQMLADMASLLQYKLMPLSELCRSSVQNFRGPVRTVVLLFAEEIERQLAPDVPACMSAALSKCQDLNGNVRYLFSELGHSLGVYDLAGQLQELENVRKNCNRVLENIECNRELRIRSYKTLAICAGIALVVLFV